MKIQFDPHLSFQRQAIDSITGIFEGQEVGTSRFTVSPLYQRHLEDVNEGTGNRLRLLEEDILKNIHTIQLRNGLRPDETLRSMDFSVEMETGTGKTYVYLRTIFELNQKYGFTKFVIVVPSIAIREGVYKSLQMTEEHFGQIYDNIPYDYFIYDSDKLSQVRGFATSSHIQIMIINIDAFRRSFTNPEKLNKANIIHRPHDRMSGQKPIELIQSTNPVVIIDEPQSVDTTPKSQKAIASLSPLCTLRYSATHTDAYHMMYKLDSVDAYEMKLVKQIEVAGIEVDDAHNKPYIKVEGVSNRSGSITARVTLDMFDKGRVKRVTRRLQNGSDLFDLSGGREIYDGYIISEVYAKKDFEYVRFSNDVIIEKGEVHGGVDEDTYKRLQIRKTIDEHLDKELRLRKQGIKVLSLFFIDRVANYRMYDDEGNPVKGKYARMFEEEYKKAIRIPKYRTLFEEVDAETIVEQVHDGYFSIDSKGRGSSKREFFTDTTGTTKKDEDTYALIMKEKEKLLSFDSKLKFIFSHSTLREGWDNPNVFQICTLNETKSVMKKRQEIGRGLRIAVNQNGERVHGHEVNTLTVMANESYEDFAKALQKEIEEEEGIRFGVVETHTFANIPRLGENQEVTNLGVEQSEQFWNYLLENNLINKRGNIEDKLRLELKHNTLVVPDEISDVKEHIIAVLQKHAGKLNVKDASKKQSVSFTKRSELQEEFRVLWDKIKYRTTYRLNFDTDKLIENCTVALRDNLRVGKARFKYQKAVAKIERSGVQTEISHEDSHIYDSTDFNLPDILSILQDETQLTRRSLAKMLIGSARLQSFTNNPQKFIEQAIQIIKSEMRKVLVDGIRYQKIGDDEYYAQELFESEELFGYLDNNMLKSEKSIYNYVIYDSATESNFASSFERNEAIKVYAKLPPWFKVDTPLGSYNPDWAVVYENFDGEKKLYFVVETKGSLFSDALRPVEHAKIECGRAHFKALESGVKYEVIDNYDTFLDVVDNDR